MFPDSVFKMQHLPNSSSLKYLVIPVAADYPKKNNNNQTFPFAEHQPSCPANLAFLCECLAQLAQQKLE